MVSEPRRLTNTFVKPCSARRTHDAPALQASRPVQRLSTPACQDSSRSAPAAHIALILRRLPMCESQRSMQCERSFPRSAAVVSISGPSATSPLTSLFLHPGNSLPDHASSMMRRPSASSMVVARRHDAAMWPSTWLSILLLPPGTHGMGLHLSSRLSRIPLRPKRGPPIRALIK